MSSFSSCWYAVTVWPNLFRTMIDWHWNLHWISTTNRSMGRAVESKPSGTPAWATLPKVVATGRPEVSAETTTLGKFDKPICLPHIAARSQLPELNCAFKEESRHSCYSFHKRSRNDTYDQALQNLRSWWNAAKREMRMRLCVVMSAVTHQL